MSLLRYTKTIKFFGLARKHRKSRRKRNQSNETKLGVFCPRNRGKPREVVKKWVQKDNVSLIAERFYNVSPSCVTSIEESFDLAEHGTRHTKITRTTTFQVQGRFRFLKSLLIWLGLKTVHRYVFQNFAQNS